MGFVSYIAGALSYPVYAWRQRAHLSCKHCYISYTKQKKILSYYTDATGTLHAYEYLLFVRAPFQ